MLSLLRRLPRGQREVLVLRYYEQADELALATPRRPSAYPIPVLSGAPSVDVTAVSASVSEPATMSDPEELDG